MIVLLRRLLCGLALCLGLLGLARPSEAQSGRFVLVAPINGIINPVQAGFVTRVIDQAEARGAAAVVFQVDTPGGLDSSMRQIIQRILAAKLPVVVYVAPGGARAGSAGVYIAYAAHVSAVAPNTNIGSATPVSLGENGEAKMSDEMRAKVTNDAVAYIRGLAEHRGRNADWAEQAVRQGANLTSTDAVQQRVVDLRADSLAALLEQIDGRSVDGVTGPLVVQTAGAAVEQVTMSPFEGLLHVVSDPTIAYILLSLGSLGLMLELYNPGQVLPGVVGGLCLLLAFYALGTLPVNYAGLLLIGFGLVLFMWDILTPTHGVLTVGGVAAFALGSLLLFNAPDGEPFLRVSIPAIVAVVGVMVSFSIFVFGALARARRRPVVTGREGLIGQWAEVRTRLAPGGYVHVESELWRARSSGRAVEPGEQVRVVALKGLTLTVEPGPVVEPKLAAEAAPGAVPVSTVGPK